MRIVLNLASQPFIELRPLYARLRRWMVVLVVLAIPLGLMLRAENRRAAEADARMAALQSNIQTLQSQQAAFKAMMSEPQNAAILSQSDFLNQLFARKAFSWTAVMMDLEDVLPAGVQVLNIDPIVAADGHVTIRMRVAGPRELTVDLVRNLEHSHRFLQPRLASEAAQTSNSGSSQNALQNVAAGAPVPVDFDILAGFNPLPNKALAAAESGAAAPAPGPVHGKRRSPANSPKANSAAPRAGSAANPAPQSAPLPASGGVR